MIGHALKLICATSLLVGLPVWAADLVQVRPEEVGLSSQRLARIGEVLTADIGKGRLPGAVALVARKGQVVYFESFGQQDAAVTSPMTRDSIFRLASMTKPVTTVAILQLLEEGRLLLNDPISRYLPQLAKRMVAVEKTDAGTGRITVSLVPAEREITVRDLLRHTSGFSDEGRSVDKQKYDDVDSGTPTSAEVIERLSELPLIYQPGTVWEYSNRSLQVAGRIVEVVSEMTLGAFFEERIFRPLGMKDTGFFVPETSLSRIAQASPDPDTGVKKPQSTIGVVPPRFENGASGLVSTAADYARFAQMLLINGGDLEGTRLLGRKTVDLMTADQVAPPVAISQTGTAPMPIGHSWGLGVAIRKERGGADTLGSVSDFYWGGAQGTFFWVDPKEQLVGILMTQAQAQRARYRDMMKNVTLSALE